MPRRTKRRRGYSWAELRWLRFEQDRTIRERGVRLYQCFEKSAISCTVSAPWTHRTQVERIVTECNPPLPIDRLSTELDKPVLPRATTLFGQVFDQFDNIAQNYLNVWRWFSEKGLCIEAVPEPSVEPDFAQVAGSLVNEARFKY